MTHVFNPVILRQYDIRGTYEVNLHDADATALGLCLAQIAFENNLKTAVVGKDARASSTPLYEALTQALADGGLHVIGIDNCATPELYFAERHWEAGVAVMVTGSHNPPKDNGFKIIVGGKPFFGDDILQLAEVSKTTEKRSGGGVESKNIRADYINRLCEEFGNLQNLKVAFDPANGALCWALEALKPHLPDSCIIINGTADGTFPSHHPDPTVAKNLEQLQKTVVQEGCDFGIAFDGDGDRLGIVDDKGEVLWGDGLIPLYADVILQKHKGAIILADVKASGSVFRHIESFGGKAVMTPAGHSIIKQKIAETKALLAGEMTGHIFFSDSYYGFDDALYAALRLWQAVGDSGKKLSQLRLKYSVDVSVQEIRLPVEESRKFPLMIEIKSYAQKNYSDIILVDGVRVSFKTKTGEGWWLIRAANTENALSLRAAGSDEESLREAVIKLQETLTHFDLCSDELNRVL